MYLVENRISKIRHRSSAIFKIFAVLVLLTGSGCTWKKALPPSVLVVAVEDLGFDALTCAKANRSEVKLGFEILCDEAVRFTHAYTPSTMSQATLASILTGRYPQDHGVRNNGDHFLSARFDTVAESAIQTGYRTAFFGGGPPIWRNSGLNQGFEVFDDSIIPSLKLIYRPALENVRLFLSWLENEVNGRAFFSVLHLNDTQFIDKATTNDDGEMRPNSYMGQVDEVNESLGTLFRRMKEKRIWDNTHVIVTGLAGHAPESRIGDSRQYSLYSDRVRVTLFIKPAYPTDAGRTSWKVDSAVSLVDVGSTLYELIGSQAPLDMEVALGKAGALGRSSALPVVSLSSVFEGAQPNWPSERLILSEAGWADWRKIGTRRIALRLGPFLYMHDSPGKAFHTLVDSLETSPLAQEDDMVQASFKPVHDFLARQSIASARIFSRVLLDKLELGQDLWRQGRVEPETLERLRVLAQTYSDDPQLQGWRAEMALRKENWAELKDAGREANQPVWEFVASRNLNERPKLPEDPCVRLFISSRGGQKAPTLRECPEQELLELLAWVDEDLPEARRQQAMERFIRAYIGRQIEERIAEQNYVAGLNWDISLTEPGGPRLSDLLLSLPEYKRYKSALARRLASF